MRNSSARAASRSALWEEERYLDELVEVTRAENDLLRARLDDAEARLSEILQLALPRQAQTDSPNARTEQSPDDGQGQTQQEQETP